MINHFPEWKKLMDLSLLFEIDKQLRVLYKTKEVFPLYKDIFRAFQLCPLDELKLIIISQDPYSDKINNLPRATGVAFANRSEISEENISPSLKVLKESIINFEIPHNNIIFASHLEEWSSQGILLLNSALTVERGKPGSHIQLWRPFISSFLQKLSMYYPGLTYVLFGNEAKSLKPYINERYNSIFEEKHPSWYARNNKKLPYEFFQEVSYNIYMRTGYKIKWYGEGK